MLQMLAASHHWLVYGQYDVDSGVPEPVGVEAIDALDGVTVATGLPLEFADLRGRSWVVHGLVTGMAETTDRVAWFDLLTGETGVNDLPPNTSYLTGSADGWLAEGPKGLVDISRSGDIRVIDPRPPVGLYLASGRGFTLATDDAVTYRSWARLDVAHVFRPERRAGERLYCSDLSAKAIECSMDKYYCPDWGCEDEPRVHHRPYYIPLNVGPPVRNPFLGRLLGSTVTGQTFNNQTLRWDFRTWHAKTGVVTTATAPGSDWVEVIGRAWERLILQRLRFDDRAGVDALIAATPDMTDYEPRVFAAAACPPPPADGSYSHLR
jgi:hypothetical protein